MFYWIANHNFFKRYTFIRKIQCWIFGHHWNAWTINKGKAWCAWCCSYTGDYPKMRKVKKKLTFNDRVERFLLKFFCIITILAGYIFWYLPFEPFYEIMVMMFLLFICFMLSILHFYDKFE